jgi:integrase/recombinase XerC
MEEIIIYQKQSIQTQSNVADLIAHIEKHFAEIYDSMDVNEKSKKIYFSNGKLFLDFIKENGINGNVLAKYKGFLLQHTGFKNEAKRQKLISAKALLSYLIKNELLPKDSLDLDIKGIKSKTQHKTGLQLDEVQLVRDYIQGITDDKKRTRLNAMYGLMTFQGLRQFEICNIDIDTINFKDKKLAIIGKGHTDLEDIDLHPKTVEALKEYLHITGKKSGYLFTSEKGTTKGARLTERGFRKIFESIFEGLGIDDRSTHGFRHFFVTTMLEETNGNIGIVKQYSRHSAIQTVMLYDDRRLKEQHNKVFYKAFDF